MCYKIKYFQKTFNKERTVYAHKRSNTPLLKRPSRCYRQRNSFFAGILFTVLPKGLSSIITERTGILRQYALLLLLAAFLHPINLHADPLQVTELRFEGNREISAGRIKRAIKTESTSWYHKILFWLEPRTFHEQTFLSDLLRIERFYHKEGYLDALVRDYDLHFNEKGNEVRIIVYIEEGQPLNIEKVQFLPQESDSIPIKQESLKKLIRLKKGKRYREEDLKADYNNLVDKFSNSGYPYIEARVKPLIDERERTVQLLWFLNSGPYCVFGDLHISGTKSVSDKVVRRGIDFQAGDPFAQRKLVEARSRIYRLELFQYVSLSATDLENEATTIPIRIRVKEAEIRSLKLGVGYGTEEGIRAKANWEHRNFFGGSRKFGAEIKHSTNLLPLNVEIHFNQPFFLAHRNDLTVKPFFTWQDEEGFEARRLGVETIFNRQLTRRTNFFASARIERNTVTIKSQSAATKTNDLYNKSVFQAGIRRNTTNKLFTPTRGSVTHLAVEESGFFFQARFRYYKIFGEYRRYVQLAPGFVLAGRIFAGSMNPFGNSTVTPVEERFFSGGSYSVRGWARQRLGPQSVDSQSGNSTPLGGNSKFEGNLELRYPTYKNLTGALFLDFGNVWEEWLGIDLTDLHYSAGIGLRYDTPIGPVRLDAAWKLNKQPTDTRDYQIHISIGHAF